MNAREGRIPLWTTMETSELYRVWVAQFRSDDEAIATAVWMANRLVKVAAKGTRKLFYSIKDGFIAHYATGDARLVRVEQFPCRVCQGKGEYDDGDPCEHCDGTGVFRERSLYLYAFVVADQRYSMHSYRIPTRVLDEPAEDKDNYGTRFTQDELDALALPLSGLMRILKYVAAAIWKMTFYGGVYV